MDLLIPPELAARRTRAAIAYSGKKLPELSAETGISEGTLRNMMSRTRPASATLDRLYVIADRCGVPRWFMEHGFLEAPSAQDGGAVDPGLAKTLERARQAVESAPSLHTRQPARRSRQHGG